MEIMLLVLAGAFFHRPIKQIFNTLLDITGFIVGFICLLFFLGIFFGKTT